MKVGVIGLGPQGLRYVKTVREHADFEMAWGLDRSDAACQKCVDTYGCQTFTDLANVSDADIVVIATNADSHRSLFEAVVAQGVRRVIVEKPMATSITDCLAMETLAKETGTRLSVMQNRRIDPFYLWLKALIDSKEFGDIRHIFIQRPGIGLGLLGTHYFDLVHYLCDAEIESVSGQIDDFIGPNPRGEQYKDPGGLINMKMVGRARATIAQIEDGAGPMTVEINLTGGRMRVEEKTGETHFIKRDLTVIPGPGRPVKYEEWTRDDIPNAKMNIFISLAKGLEDIATDDHVLQSAHGRRSIEVLAAAHYSDKQDGRWIGLNDMSFLDAAKDTKYAIT